MLQLRLQAPFGAFRHLAAGSYRPSAPFLTPSAAYGLLLNIAGIETRWDDGKAAMTLMRKDLPQMKLAIGRVAEAEVQTLYQQLHNYPVGATGKDRAESCKGNKYNIQPIRREFLSGIDASLWCRSDDGVVEERIRRGLRGEPLEGVRRYGLPFLGDNNFLIDVLREEPDPPPAQWLRRLRAKDPQAGTERMRMTISIDRADMTKTSAGLFAWSEEPSAAPPDAAWVVVPEKLEGET
ncbi:MAG: CRISPR-associated protein Cas5 [Bryobacteraceae bacterium]